MNWYKLAKSFAIGPVYHGTNEIFDEYDPIEAGLRGDHQTAQLGMFFTTDEYEAETYGTNLITAMLSVNNPYKTTWQDIREEDGWELKDRLIAEGYDGVFISDASGNDWWVIFEASQMQRIN
jgi:hypothetical protein